jgi:O-antigen/teichoic acid export membrane protein
VKSGRAAAAEAPGRHLLKGSVWMLALRWAVRLTGVVSTVFLARLLTPADFGIVTMALIFVGLMETLNMGGQQLALIRLSAPTREHYDTAWTLYVIMGFAIGAAIAALAPLTRLYFSDPRVVPVMQCMALRSVIGGFENIGTVDFRRDLQFQRAFLYNYFPKLVSLLVVVPLAAVLRNYWALVAAMLASELSQIALSYAMHPYRPRLSLERVGDILSFSFWTLFRFFGQYANLQVDQAAVGGVSGVAAMGRYSLATDLATLPSREINEPMVIALYPVMATVIDDRQRLRDLYLRTLCWSAIICASTSVGVACVAHDLVRLVLGAKWLDAEPLVGWLALSAGVLGLSSGAYTTFDVIGRPHLGARMQWTRLLLLVVAIAPVAYLTRNAQFIAATRLLVTIIFVPNLFFVLGRAIGVSPHDYLRAFWRPFAAAGVMAAMIFFANMHLSLVSSLRLLCDVALGAATYGTMLFLLWVLSGCPNTPERDLITFLRSRWPFPGNSARALPSDTDRPAPAMEAVATRTGPTAGE